jgi:hypothetical protein
MPPISTPRETASTRGFATIDPERQGVLVAMMRGPDQAGAAKAATSSALAAPTSRPQDGASRPQRATPFTGTPRA